MSNLPLFVFETLVLLRELGAQGDVQDFFFSLSLRSGALSLNSFCTDTDGGTLASWVSQDSMSEEEGTTTNIVLHMNIQLFTQV